MPVNVVRRPGRSAYEAHRTRAGNTPFIVRVIGPEGAWILGLGLVRPAIYGRARKVAQKGLLATYSARAAVAKPSSRKRAANASAA